MFMVMFVLDNYDLLDDVLDAWDALGVRGVTIVESTGIQRRRVRRGLIPFRFDFEGLGSSDQQGHYTLFAIVASEDLARQCLVAAEAVVGDLDQPNTGVLAAWPLALVKGIPDSPARAQ